MRSDRRGFPKTLGGGVVLLIGGVGRTDIAFGGFVPARKYPNLSRGQDRLPERHGAPTGRGEPPKAGRPSPRSADAGKEFACREPFRREQT